MFDQTTDLFDSAKKAFEPAARLGDLSSKILGEVVDLQLKMAVDAVDFAAAQADAIASYETPTAYFETQRALGAEYMERAKSNVQTCVDMIQEAQKSVAGWTEEAAAAVSEVVPLSSVTGKKAA